MKGDVYNLMNKKIGYLFSIVILITSLVGCAMQKGDADYVDGIPFVYYDSFACGNKTYEVYQVEQVKLLSSDLTDIGSIKYDYQEIEKLSSQGDANNWIINYYQNYEYQMEQAILEKEVLDALYVNILDSLKVYETSLDISFEYYEEGRIVERELVVDSKKDFSSVLIVDLYIPYRVVDTTNIQTYIIYIPVKTSLAYRNNNVIEFVFDDKTIVVDYYAFISLSNSETV